MSFWGLWPDPQLIAQARPFADRLGIFSLRGRCKARRASILSRIDVLLSRVSYRSLSENHLKKGERNEPQCVIIRFVASSMQMTH